MKRKNREKQPPVAQKKPEEQTAQPVQAPRQPVSVAVKGTSFGRLPGWLLPAVALTMLYFAMFLPSGRMSMILTFVTLAMTVVFFMPAVKNLRDRLSLPVIGLLAFALVSGFAAIYAPVGTPASAEFVKLLASLPVAFVILLWAENHHLRTLYWGVTVFLGLLALVCVDSSASTLLYGGFCAVMDALGANFGALNQYVTAGRINGLYNNANVIACMFSVGGLLSIWLARSGEKKWEKPLAFFLMGLNAMAFFLSMSRGAILCFGVTLIAYVIFTGKEERLSLVFLLAETVVITVALSAVAMGFLGTSGSFLPVLLTLICGPVVYALDRFVGSPLSVKLVGKGKAIALSCGLLAALAVAYVAVGLSVTNDYTFRDGQRLFRSEELVPGDYTMAADCSGEVEVTVTAAVGEIPTRNQMQILYEGSADDVRFTVPEGTQYVDFAFHGEGGDILRSAVLSDGTELPMNYPLIPAFVANRLHEQIFKGSSFTMRAQYVEDGFALFVQRPLLGFGLGGSQVWGPSVQSFYYEVKFLHNHVVQVLADQGLLGVVPFLTMLLGAAGLLIRRLRQERDALAAVLLACWVMINLHSLMELNFSIRGFQAMAYPLLALMLVSFPGRLKLPEGKKAAQRVGAGAVAFVTVWLAFFGVTYEIHRLTQAESADAEYVSNDHAMQSMAAQAKRDWYDPEQLEINFMANAQALGDPRYLQQIPQFAENLRERGVYAGCAAACRYYYLPAGDMEELFACSREGIANLSGVRDVWNLQFLFYFEEVLPAIGPEQFEAFVAGVDGTRAMLAEVDAGRLEKIEIVQLNQELLAELDAVKELPAEEGYAQMLAFALAEFGQQG